MSWFADIALVFAGVALVVLHVRVSVLSSDLHDLWKFTRMRLDRIEEDQRNGMVTLRMDLGLSAQPSHCAYCLQLVYGPRAGKHKDWCPNSEATWVRNYKRDYPGQPLPEGVEDPDEQQQQGPGAVPG